MHPDRLAELEDERRFLLRSLADLEREHDAGDVEDDDYVTLKDDYTARAATVLRSIDQGLAALPTKPRRRPAITAAWVVGVVAVASLAGWLMARSSGQRVAGQEITGGQPVDAVTAKLSEARSKTGTDAEGAIALYDEVLAIEPDNVEAKTYSAWIAITSNIGDADANIAKLAEVTSMQPDYADAHCLYAVASARFADEPDIETAKAQGQLCLDNDPPSGMVDMVQGFLDGLDGDGSVEDAGGSVVPTTAGELPDDVDGLLAAGLTALENGDLTGAAEAYRRALDIDPENSAARTYTAWVLALGSQDASDAGAKLALDQATESFERVIADDPTYPDAHCLYAVMATQFYAEPDTDLAKAQAEACRANDPDPDLDGLLRDYVDPLVAAAG